MAGAALGAAAGASRSGLDLVPEVRPLEEDALARRALVDRDVTQYRGDIVDWHCGQVISSGMSRPYPCRTTHRPSRYERGYPGPRVRASMVGWR